MTSFTAERWPRPAYRARFATFLGIAFLASLSFPVLIELPGGVTPGHILMLASLPVWFAAAANRNGTVFDEVAGLASAAIVLCATLLIFCCVISAFRVDDPFRAARPIVSLAGSIALLALVVGTVTRERLSTYVNVLCFTLAATSVFTIVAFVEPRIQSIIFQKGDRAFGFFKNPNQFGIALSTVLPVAVAMLFARRGRRLLWGACVLALVLGIIFTGSKANLLVSAVTVPSCLVLFSLVSFTGKKRLLMAIVTVVGSLLAGAIAVLVLGYLNPRTLSLLGEFVVEGEATYSLVSRSILWSDSIEMLVANPVLGVGAGTPLHGLTHSHNVVLDYARTLGVPGLVLISIELGVILAVCAATILLALRSGTAELGDRYLCIGMAFGPIAYIGGNFSSDSLGPTTSAFLYTVLFLGLASRSLLAPRESTVH